MSTEIIQENKLSSKLSIRDIAAFCKLRLATLVVMSAAFCFVLASKSVDYSQLIILIVGGFLVTASSNGFNQIIERNLDKLMTRTQNRPLPTERMTMPEAVISAGVMGVSGIIILTYFFNPVAGVLSAVSLLSYAFVYTPLKRITPVAVFVGAIPGALPPMIGYVCATGSIDFVALVLFSIQFIWQFPHFWSIAWLQFDDYQKAGIMLLPSPSGKTRASAIQNVVYCTVLLVVSMVPYFFNMVSMTSNLLIVAAGIVFLWMSWNHYVKCEDRSAKVLMFGSFLYLPVMQLAIAFGKL